MFFLIFPISLGGLLMIALFFLGLGYSIATNLPSIIFTILMVTFGVIGLFALVYRIFKLVKLKKSRSVCTVLCCTAAVLTYLLRFLYAFCGVILLDFFVMLAYGEGPMGVIAPFGSVPIAHQFIAELLFLLIFLISFGLPYLIRDRPSHMLTVKTLRSVSSVLLIFVLCFGVFQFSLKSRFHNSLDVIDFSGTELTATEDCALYQYESNSYGWFLDPQTLVSTGTIREGTPLYRVYDKGESRNVPRKGDSDSSPRVLGSEEVAALLENQTEETPQNSFAIASDAINSLQEDSFYFVSDGTRTGYVSGRELALTVTYSYVLTEETALMDMELGSALRTLPAGTIVQYCTNGKLQKWPDDTSCLPYAAYQLVVLEDDTVGYVPASLIALQTNPA